MTLTLKYHCTTAEAEEAKKLQEYNYYGRGSKWRGRLVVLALLTITLVAYAVRFKREITPHDRPWFIGICVVAFVAVLVFKWIARHKAPADVRLQISEREVIIGAGDGRTVIEWPGFSQCLESRNVFVLVNRSRTLLFTIPKRAFPDEAAREWFRSQTSQLDRVPPNPPAEPLVSGRFVTGNGIAVMQRLNFWDYLNRNFTSWRLKGIFLLVLALATVPILLSKPPSDAVNPPWKIFAIMVAILLGVMALVLVFISFYFWFLERKHLPPQQVVFNEAGIDFASHDSHGRLPWSTYTYYLENRWSFFVWRPQGSLWLLLPKRDFACPSDLAQFRALLESKLKRSRWFYL